MKKFVGSAMSNAFYAQVDPRRRQEIKDSRMVQEDQTAMSNLSEKVVYRQYNPNYFKHDCNKAAAPMFVFNDEVE